MGFRVFKVFEYDEEGIMGGFAYVLCTSRYLLTHEQERFKGDYYWRRGSKTKKVAARDCMMVVKEIVNRILEEVEVSLFRKKFEQDIDDEGEEDEESEGGSKVWEFNDLNNRKDSITWQSMVWMEEDANMV
uniref:Uncharacterized protein n=1 Tax=Tanacetum cinerariifolium TaxID=118510 RepID=A0A6L2JLP2_TANCI|nr:hypothetical protein [Tanacetum cinerariifolium]